MNPLRSLTLATLALCGSIGASAELISKEPAPENPPKVQLALLLDTSSSMDGLIGQAKSQLWKIVNEFIAAKQDGKTPKVEVALYEYGNSGLATRNGYVRLISPLTQDLDKLSEELFALKTNGGEEYCGWVIRDAVEELSWNDSQKTYKAIFIAGNEPFSQGPVKYRDACQRAIEHGIIVNTIHCGDEREGVKGKWKDGAALADGTFLVINQDAKIRDIAAPQDKQIAELNAKLNDTYIGYGRAGAEGKARQKAQDENVSKTDAPAAVMASRAGTKASANYENRRWDLVDATKKKDFDLSKVKEEELPEELRKLPPTERSKWIDDKRQEREELQKRLGQLAAEREKFVAQQQKEHGKGSTLDQAMVGAIHEQAGRKAFQFEGN